MATTTAHPPAPSAPRDPRDRRLGRDRPIGGLELWTWLFMRVSGLLLLVLALGHLVIMHLLETGAERIDFGFVAVRWENPFWRTWDWMLLILALVHGINGLRNITLDYVKRPGLRLSINLASHVLGFVLMVLGTVIVVTFDASNWPGAV